LPRGEARFAWDLLAWLAVEVSQVSNDDAYVRVQLLGPVRAWRGNQELELGGPKQRAVLGMLAMRANRIVTRDEIVDGVWGQCPPASAVNSVHVYVSGLRRVIEPRRARRAPGWVLVAAGGGYQLRLDPDQLDVSAFRQHLEQGRLSRDAGDLHHAADLLCTAARIWQSAPLSGIPGPWAEIERVRLNELRLTAIEERIEVAIACGKHAEAIAELMALVREHPLRERLYGQLMLALYQCGRRAEALAVFADTRRVLNSELGIEPSPELGCLYKRILAADASPDAPGTGYSAEPAGPASQA
jgi:DNA-binding SARP family transcriptional activator